MVEDEELRTLHLAVDDTDSREGGMCTTFLVQRLLDALPRAQAVKPPHLVRLNPSVPWRTRGNGAVALTLRTGWTPGEVLDRAAKVVSSWAMLDAEGTQPGLAVTPRRPPPEVYLRTVRDVVTPAWARRVLEDAGAAYRGWNGGRGLVGCAGALAWTPDAPERRCTWELLTYRHRERWGTPREVDAATLREVDRGFPTLFDTWDPDQDEPACVPRGPDPVLHGLRGTDPDDLREAAEQVAGEPAVEATLFRTNQASDDHLAPCQAGSLRPGTGTRLELTIEEQPWRTRGGHVFAEARDGTGAVTLAAFEPTGSFRHVVTALHPGDRVVAFGGVAQGPKGEPTVHLEKLQVLEAPPRRMKTGNPRCNGCERAMKSRGRGAGYRCPTCGGEAGEDAAPTRRVERALEAGWYEVPPGARRHLARPLELMAVPARDRAKAYDPERSIPHR